MRRSARVPERNGIGAARPVASPTGEDPLDLTVVILTYNEQLHLERALASVRGIARRIVVVDSYSNDATLDIARAGGAEVLQHPFVNQARQFRWALDKAALDTAWTMRLDADEIVEPDLAAKLRQTLPSLPPEVTGINLKRRHVYMDRWIRHGGRYPLVMLRLFRTGKGIMEDRWMDEHLTVTEGRTITLDGGFTDHNLNDLSYFTQKHDRYATREAIETLKLRHALGPAPQPTLALHTASPQLAAKRWVKTRLYDKMPFPLAALGYFLYRYIWQLGFLDGLPGLVYHTLQGFWYRFLVGARVWELERAIQGKSAEDARRELKRLTGYDLSA